MEKDLSLLIIGPLPQPMGGVSIHVSRTLEHLADEDYQYHFLNSKGSSLIKYVKAVIKVKQVHIHISQPMVRFALLFIASILGKQTIATFHGKIFNHGKLKNYFQKLCLKWSSYPITLNDVSYQKAKELNRSSQMISSFLAPKEESLNANILDAINSFKTGLDRVYCTNAYKVSYDKDGNDIYSIVRLVELLSSMDRKIGLIIADPISSYRSLLKEKGISIPENVLFINEAHPFIEVIKLSDAFIRATYTDGDSISVKEALFVNKPVITSDVVDRPKGVELFNINDFNTLKVLLENLDFNKSESTVESAFPYLLKIYQSNL